MFRNIYNSFHHAYPRMLLTEKVRAHYFEYKYLRSIKKILRNIDYLINDACCQGKSLLPVSTRDVIQGDIYGLKYVYIPTFAYEQTKNHIITFLENKGYKVKEEGYLLVIGWA